TLRFALAALLMLLFFAKSILPHWRATWRLSLPIGLALGIANLTQSSGINLTTANKAGFYTSLSVVLVPLLQALWFRTRPSKIALGSATLALIGLACLSNILAETPDFNLGDILIFICAFMFAIHVLLFDRLPEHIPRTSIVAQQFLLTALINLPMGLIYESWPADGLSWQVWGMVIFLAVGATILAFSVLAWAQRHLSASNTALILILEPVFAAGFSWIWLGETLGLLGTIGAVIIIASLAVSSRETGY
ncbi:MAG: DMT family transporter, partial [Symbiobacteriaceae bacterium]|nr:DMT family transporter [Symbiobacteriaceae bacterium]